MERLYTLAARFGAWAAKPDKRIGWVILAATLLPLMVLCWVAQVKHAIGYGYGFHFFTPEDRFADIIKVALSYTTITGSLPGSAHVADWTPVYRDYLLAHPVYEGMPLTHYNMPPLGALVHMGVAEILVYSTPATALWAVTFLYLGLALTTIKLMGRDFSTSRMDQGAMVGTLMLSYPALFMLTRGNVLAGYTTLFIALYALTVMSNRQRWLGLLCLALAINLRPNVAVFGLLELIGLRKPLERVQTIAACAGATLALLFASYAAVHAIEPSYTVQSFLEGLRVYNIAYVQGDAGMAWNFSLYGIIKLARDILDIHPLYEPVSCLLVSLLGAAVALTSIVLALRHRLDAVTACFVATSMSVLFTPVLAFYHVTEFCVPLLACLAHKGAGTSIRSQDRAVFVTCLLLLCPIDAKRTIYPLLIAAVMLNLLWRSWRNRAAAA